MTGNLPMKPLSIIAPTLNEPQFIEAGYKAHATVRPHARLHENEQVKFSALTLIDLFPDKDPYKRKVLATIPFTEQ